MKKIKEIIENVSDLLSLSGIAKVYFDKDRSWFYHKLNEDVINSVRYGFTDSETDVLITALDDVSNKIACTTKNLKKLQAAKLRQKGKFYTVSNPFDNVLFREWQKLIPQDAKYVEPFAGSNNIVKWMREVCAVNDWTCYDISPSVDNNVSEYKIVKRNCIINFPKGFDSAVSNPPYLAKNSASRRGLPYPETKYDDLYKLCLDLMLKHCKYVAAILPDSFTTTDLFRERLYGVISLNMKVFDGTNCPVCLALFVPEKQSDFLIFRGDKKIGMYNALKEYTLDDYLNLDGVKWSFNDAKGNIAVKCVDGYQEADICFFQGSLVDSSKIKYNSRSVTRVGGLKKSIDLDIFLKKCNEILCQYRKNTEDVFLTSFKGLRKDSKYRKRIDFKTIRCIMNKALCELNVLDLH